MRRIVGSIAGAYAVMTLAGCGASTDPPPDPRPALVVVENASQYVIEELRFHGLPQYGAAPNMLLAPLPVGAISARHMQGSSFVTVFREKFRGGELVALTTQQPITFSDGTGYRIKVFDTAFRVLGEPYVPPAMTSSTSTTAGL